MGYFDDLETPIEDVHVGFGLPNGEHEVILTDIKNVKNAEKGDKVVADFTVQGGKLNGKKHTEWVNVPQKGNQYFDYQVSGMKAFLLSIGVPESYLGEFDADDVDDKASVIGAEGILSLKPQKKNPDYQNAYFKLNDEQHESGVSDFEPGKFDSDPETGTFDPDQF